MILSVTDAQTDRQHCNTIYTHCTALCNSNSISAQLYKKLCGCRESARCL